MRLRMLVLAASLAAAGCGGGGSGFVMERGATISVRTIDELATGANHAGDTFHADVDVPVRDGVITYVPLDATVDGVVETASLSAGPPPTARLVLRLNRLNMPDGTTIPLETMAMTHEERAGVQMDEITITTGLDVDLDSLVGRDGAPAASGDQPAPQVVIAPNTPLVFTLAKDLPLPMPSASN